MAPPTPDPFRFHRDVEVRYSDVDAAGHVHHARTLLFFEEVRAAYWREVVAKPGLGDIDYVLAEACVRWRGRILWPGHVRASVRVSAMGRKHFRAEYVVRSPEGEELVTGHTVQVMYDYAAGASKPIPAEVRRAIEAFEGDALEGLA